MANTTRVGGVDVFGRSDLRQLVEAEGPCVSLFLPVHRAGPQTRQDPIRFRNMLDAASGQLAALGFDERQVGALLAPERALLDDGEFWRHQAEGLALFASPSTHRAFRVPLELAEDVVVGDTFRVRPLLPWLTGDGRFFLLALSQNEVRLFQATRTTIGELDRGDMPGSLAEALAYDDHESELQFRSGGQPAGEGVMFHGHGMGDEVEKAEVERFLRRVDRGLWSLVGDHGQPLVLACVAYYVPLFRSLSRHPYVLEGGVEGNPEGKRPEELHAEAWRIVEPLFGAKVEEALRRYGDATGTGLTVSGIDEVVGMAREGRVDTLFTIAGPPPGDGDSAGAGDGQSRDAAPPEGESHRLDRAVVDTLLTSGWAFVLDEADLPGGGCASALLRY